jgi:epoxyqueuosine reductase QueG
VATISVYARNRDYHDLVKKRLKRVGRWLLDAAGGDAEIKVFVDTAPVMEKPLAAAAGLGWQGKHTNLLGRDIGNWVFLGAIFTTLDLPPTRRRPIIAAAAAPVSTSARPMPSRRPTNSMRGAAFPT